MPTDPGLYRRPLVDSRGDQPVGEFAALSEPPAGVSRRNFMRLAAAAGAAATLAGRHDLARGSMRGETVESSAVEASGRATSANVSKGPAMKPERTHVTLNVNGRGVPMAIDARVTLLDALRDYADLPGTKKGCDHGQCGACTVLVNGRRVNSCLTLAVMHTGDHITTIEGLATGEKLHPMQQAFLEHDGFQCGYCTPGQICSAIGLVHEGHAKSDESIREQMSGNICRCGAYPNIVAAVRQVLDHRGAHA